jgi:putative ABC transport system ATP-binding protein
MNPILKLEDVHYSYKNSKKEVLKNINMDFEEGKIYTIVGKSGAGKTTLLSLISGLDKVKKGAIYFKDEDVAKMDSNDYRANDVGVVFQNYNLIRNATAIENLELSMDISSKKFHNKRYKAMDLLEQVGIEADDAARKVNNLSGGQQQRVGIARALCTEADIIIADEPTGNLDHETEEQIVRILKNLAYDQKKCVIIVTHNQGVAKIGDVKYGLQKGNVMQIV